MNATVCKLMDIDSIEIPEQMLKISIDEKDLDSAVGRLSVRYANESLVETAKKGDIVFCRADSESYPDGRTIILFTGALLPESEKAAADALGKKVSESFETTLAGKSVTLTVEKIIRKTPREVNDDLIASIGIEEVKTVADYRNYIKQKMLDDIESQREKEISMFIMDEFINGSEFSFDEAQMDEYVKKSMEEYAEYAQEDEEPMSEEEFRKAVVFQQKQFWAAEEFCRSRAIKIDMSLVEEEVGQMIEMSQLMGEDVPDREQLLEETIQNEQINELFVYIDQIIKKKVGSHNGNR